MTHKISFRDLFIFGGLLGLVFLFTIDFFNPDEKVKNETSAYIGGATPSYIEPWEMY